MVGYVLVDRVGSVLARSNSYSYLKRKKQSMSGVLFIRKDQLDTITTTSLPARQRVHEIKESKTAKKLQRRWARTAAKKIRRRELLPSSFVNYLEYNPEEGTAWIILGEQKYTVLNLRESAFNAWFRGSATCQTNDPSGQNRYWVDKNPSTGAYFNHYVKKKNTVLKGWIGK